MVSFASFMHSNTIVSPLSIKFSLLPSHLNFALYNYARGAENERACVWQLCHFQEQLQLNADESIPLRQQKICKPVPCIENQHQMIDVCICMCPELTVQKGIPSASLDIRNERHTRAESRGWWQKITFSSFYQTPWMFHCIDIAQSKGLCQWWW